MAEEQKPKVANVKDVLAKDKEKKPESKTEKSESKSSTKKKKSKMKHTHLEHHYDESGKSMGHTVRHTPMGGGEEVSYTAPDLDAVHDGMEEHLGEANADEGAEQPDAAAGGAPQEAAPAAKPAMMA
jgi:hypothetical protein